MKKLVWTEAYMPFRFGPPHGLIGTEVEVGDPVSVGADVEVYVVPSPGGVIHIAEASSGAFVGTSLDQVKDDIKTGDPKLMKKQMREALELIPTVRVLSNDEFWSFFRTAEERARLQKDKKKEVIA